MTASPTHIDCFAGPGGFCTGLKAAGFRTLMAFEKVETVCETYAANHPEVDLIQGDIRQVPDDQLAAIGPVDLVTAGFPCETFSTAGNKSRASYDHRQTLFMEAVRIAVACKSRFVLCENVPAILTKPLVKGETKLVIDEIRRVLREAGYRNQLEAVLNTADYGVPQTRRRFFLLACRDDDQLVRPVPSAARQTTVGDAFCGLPLQPSETAVAEYPKGGGYAWNMGCKQLWNATAWCDQQLLHVCPGHRPATVERFGLIPQGGRLSDLFKTLDPDTIAELQQRRVLPKVPYQQRGQRLHPDRPSPTVTSHCLDELVHPTEPRCLTVREAARLQSFPDGYDFRGPLSCPHQSETQDKYEQIGDAVPPLMAMRWGEIVATLASK